MGLFGLFGLGRRKEEAAISIPAAAQEEPEFLKKIEAAAEKEVEKLIESGKKADEAADAREEVEPELALWLSNGMTVKSLKELATALKKMKIADYKEHVNEERNEVAEWVREVLNDEALARQLRRARGKMQAARQVEKEVRARALKALKATATVKKKTEPPAEMEEVGEQPMQQTLPEGRKPRRWLFFFRKNGWGKKEEADILDLRELMPAAGVKEGKEKEEEEKAAAGFEPEPHHVQWSEAGKEKVTAEEIKESIEAQAAKAISEKPLKEETERKPRKSYEEAELDKKRQELERLENGLNKEEEELNRKRLELTRTRYDLVKQKGELEKQRFEAFMKTHRLIAQKEEASLPQQQELGWAEEAADEHEHEGLPNFRLASEYGKDRLQALLEEAKQNLSQNNIGEAQKTLERAQYALTTAYMPLQEKKQMEYELLEVEADLKLASLK